jgi:AcrR family transcriptional regulator
MNTSTPRKRSYASKIRTDAAVDTRLRILEAAKSLMGRKGIDKVTIAEIGEKAAVAASTIYAIFKSKEGILRALMEQTLFGSPFRSAQELLDSVTDPVRLIELTAHVARAIYESESTDLGLLRHASGFSLELRKIEQEFEQIRYEMQERRLVLLFEEGKARAGLSLEDARRILWMYTSRDVYRMLVSDGGWSPDRYQDWLAGTLLDALVDRKRGT